MFSFKQKLCMGGAFVWQFADIYTFLVNLKTDATNFGILIKLCSQKRWDMVIYR